MKKEIICTACPMGCTMTAEGTETEVVSITGYTCPRGEKYGRQEYLDPQRILTTTVLAEGTEKLVPVRSDRPMSRALLGEAMEIIRRTRVKLPVALYDVIIPDICGSGASIVATAETV